MGRDGTERCTSVSAAAARGVVECKEDAPAIFSNTHCGSSEILALTNCFCFRRFVLWFIYIHMYIYMAGMCGSRWYVHI